MTDQYRTFAVSSMKIEEHEQFDRLFIRDEPFTELNPGEESQRIARSLIFGHSVQKSEPCNTTRILWISGAIVAGLPEIVVTCWRLSCDFAATDKFLTRDCPVERMAEDFWIPHSVENHPPNNKSVVYGSLIWISELRLHVVLTGIVMHLVFEAVMNQQLFGWTMIAGLLLFSDPVMVERFFFLACDTFVAEVVLAFDDDHVIAVSD